MQKHLNHVHVRLIDYAITKDMGSQEIIMIKITHKILSYMFTAESVGALR